MSHTIGFITHGRNVDVPLVSIRFLPCLIQRVLLHVAETLIFDWFHKVIAISHKTGVIEHGGNVEVHWFHKDFAMSHQTGFITHGGNVDFSMIC